MRKIIFIAISFFICQALSAQDSASLKIKIIKKNFKEDTLKALLLPEIELQTKYKSNVDNKVSTIMLGKNMLRVNDSIFIISGLTPGIYFVKPFSKNVGIVFQPDWKRTVACTKCDANITLEAIQLKPDEDWDSAFSPYFSGHTTGYSAYEGFYYFSECAYLDSIRADFSEVLRRKEKRKIAKAQFKVEAFLTSGKEISDIKVLPETLDIELKSIIIKGFNNIKFWKQQMPDLIRMISYKNFSGDKITLTSSELLTKNFKKAK